MAVTSLAGSFQVSFGILHLYSAGKRPRRLVVRTSHRGRDNPCSTPGVNMAQRLLTHCAYGGATECIFSFLFFLGLNPWALI